jgi:hypothetical protein
MEKHRQIGQFYDWGDIAERTERVYAEAMAGEGIKVGQRMNK